MVKQEVKFSDGTRIFYEDDNGVTQRYIEYGYSPQDIQQLNDKPFLKETIEKQVRKYNAGKYYYLRILYGIAHGFNDAQRNQLFNELKELHDKVGLEYDINTVRNYIKPTFGKYWYGNEIQCAAFFVTIYLAMLDLEENKNNYPNSLGKTMVLKSCEAVILEGKDPNSAATMFNRKKQTISNDYIFDDDNYYINNSRYEKYNGYNGFDDDTIDEAFDGRPDATWNVD
jgi:hypothetical protein